MTRTVVAFENEASRSGICEMLEKNGINVRYTCRTGLEAIRAIKKMGGGVVVCGYKLADMTAEQLADDLQELATFLVIGKPHNLDFYENEDIFKLPLPIRIGELVGSVNMLIQLDEKKLRRSHPRRSAEDDRLITMAKQLLMSRNDMSEDQAYRFIQRKSMETSSKMTETARLILQALD